MKVSEFIENYPQSTELVARIEEIRSEENRRRDLVQAFSSCAACGGALSLAVQTDWIRGLVEESGECQDCSAKTPRRRYGLH